MSDNTSKVYTWSSYCYMSDEYSVLNCKGGKACIVVVMHMRLR